MKKYSLGIIAFVFAIATAFTTKPAFSTFQFNGTSTDPTHRVDPLKYSVATPGCPGSEVKLCSIIAPESSGRPVIGSPGDILYDKLDNNGLTVPDFSPTYIIGYTP